VVDSTRKIKALIPSISRETRAADQGN